MKEDVTHWGSQNVGKRSSIARVADAPLVQAVVRAAESNDFSYPAVFAQKSGIPYDVLNNFLRGKTVLSPENMMKAAELLHGVRDALYDLYGCELRKGKGSFQTVRGTERANISAQKAQVFNQERQLNTRGRGLRGNTPSKLFTFSEAFKAAAREGGFTTLTAIARELGISIDAISLWTNGKEYPTPENWKKIKYLFREKGVSPKTIRKASAKYYSYREKRAEGISERNIKAGATRRRNK